MTGYFGIRPRDETVTELGVLDNIGTSAYCLVSQDLKESEREKILYSEGGRGGSLAGKRYGLITVTFNILVNGNTADEVDQNMGVIHTLLFDASGGHILYVPVGYSSSVMKTYYEYLRSSPPSVILLKGEMQPSNANYSLASLYKFDVKVFALATSNPYTLDTIHAASQMNTFIDQTGVAAISIPPSSMKGDGIIPEIRLFISVANTINDIIINLYDVEDGVAVGYDLYDWSDSGRIGSLTSDLPSFTVNDRFYTASPVVEWNMSVKPVGYRSLLSRECFPIFSFVSNSGDGQYEYRIIQFSTYLDWIEQLTDWKDLPNAGVPDDYWNIEIGDTIVYPSKKLPLHVPTIEVIGTEIGIHVREKTSTPGNIQVYGILLVPSDRNAWVARFTSQYPGVDDMDVYDSAIMIDAINNISYRFIGTTGMKGPSRSWKKTGMPISDLIMPKGNYHLRVLSYGDTVAAKGWYHLSNAFYIEIDAVHYTIYPFSEA